MLAIEFGWLFLTEMGRQPWIVRGYMRIAKLLHRQEELH